MIEQALSLHSINPYSGIEIGSLAVLKRAVQGDLGIAIVPIAIANPPTGTVLRNMSEVNLGLPVGLIQAADNGSPGQALQALLASLRAYLRT